MDKITNFLNDEKIPIEKNSGKSTYNKHDKTDKYNNSSKNNSNDDNSELSLTDI